MSHLMHVIYSDFFTGVGIAAGGPYGCTGTNGYSVTQCKTVPKDIDVDVIENLAVKMEKEGLI